MESADKSNPNPFWRMLRAEAAPQTDLSDKRHRRGRAELQSGSILLLLSGLGLVALWLWGSGFVSADPLTVFTGNGFASAVIGIMLVGVFAIGLILLAVGAILWLRQQIRDERRRADSAK